jgi:integrase
MAKQDFPPDIDRRRLLVSAVALAGSSISSICRRSEILNLRWAEIDFEQQCLRLPDSKTGAKVVYLNALALAILQTLPRFTENPYVIAGKTQDSPLVGIDKVWFRVRRNAGLANVRLHDLRHSFASVGALGGLSLPLIGALLGHKHPTTTSRYAHLSADPIRAASEMIAARIAAAMDGVKAEVLPYPAKFQDSSAQIAERQATKQQRVQWARSP